MKLKKISLASAQDRFTAKRVKRNRRDAQRVRRKAVQYEKEAKSITIQVPAVVKTCPEAPPFCQTVDRGASIEALRVLYTNQYNTIGRVVSKAYFRNTGTTGRRDTLKVRAKTLRDQGLAELAKLPRFSVDCE